MNASRFTFAAMSAVVALAATPVMAGNACKGLSEHACAASESCSWIDAYVRKDGREVGAYCRARPATKSSLKGSEGPAPAAG
jgi:hypothetical protein